MDVRASSLLLALFTVLAGARALAADLPNPILTPGVVLTTDVAEVCVPGYAGNVRNVSAAKKRAVYKRYGLPYNDRSKCVDGAEVDHLISLQLGGSNDIRNLWPESYCGTWNAHVKDRLENHLHRMVCDGEISLREAQRIIAKDWIEAYRKYLGESP